MTIATAFDMILATVVLGLGVWTIAVRESHSAVVGFVAYGLSIALVWVHLDAVDVALTEAAIGGGLGGVLLLAALSASVAAAIAAAGLLLPGPAPMRNDTPRSAPRFHWSRWMVARKRFALRCDTCCSRCWVLSCTCSAPLKRRIS